MTHKKSKTKLPAALNQPTGGATVISAHVESAVVSSAVNISIHSTIDATIDHVVFCTQCINFQTHLTTLVDASLVLRHSIHKNSVRNPASGIKWDHKTHAIVQSQAEEYSSALKHARFEVIVFDLTVRKDEIRGDFL